MAKKIKKFPADISSRRGSAEKMRRAVSAFNRAVIAYLVMVVCAVFFGKLGEYNLGDPTVNGFPLCFLLLPAYLPLMVIGWGGLLIGAPVAVIPGEEAVLLGLCDIFLAFNVWWIVRLVAARRQSIVMLRTARVFVMIMVIWGIFQIGCSATLLLWRHSGFTMLHTHLYR